MRDESLPEVWTAVTHNTWDNRYRLGSSYLTGFDSCPRLQIPPARQADARACAAAHTLPQRIP